MALWTKHEHWANPMQVFACLRAAFQENKARERACRSLLPVGQPLDRFSIRRRHWGGLSVGVGDR